MKLNAFFEQLKARRVRKTMAIYMSSALSAVAVTKLFLEVYQLPPVIFPILVSILTCGVASAFTFAWYHGVEGAQRFTRKELLLHGCFLALAVVLSYRMAGTPQISNFVANAKAIAVLPFKNMSENKEDEYFSDGITEDILTQLSKIGDLQVISRTSVMKYKDTQKNVREIGQELSVGSILEGSVRHAGNRVRIVGKLTDAAEDKLLWAETYDRELKDIFAIQSEVAQQIAGALRATLSPVELEFIAKKPTDNTDAYAFYLRGREYFYHYSRDDNERAIALFEKALEVDPRYALAYAGLGDAYGRRCYYDFPLAWLDSAVAVSTLAITIDPNLAEGYNALGNARQAKGELRAALGLYTKAVALNPNYAAAINNVGFASWLLGAYDEAAKWMKKASLLQPGFARWTTNVGFNYLHLGLDSLTEVWLRKAIDLQPDFVFPYIWLAYHHLYRGRVDSARACIARALAITPDEFLALVAGGDVELLNGSYKEARRYYEKSVSVPGSTGELVIKLPYVLHKLGEKAKAESLATVYLAAYAASPDRHPEGSPHPYSIATLYAWRGDTTKANLWLEHAIKLGYRDYRWISVDPQLEDIRNTAQYRQIISSLRTTYEQMRERALRQAMDN